MCVYTTDKYKVKRREDHVHLLKFSSMASPLRVKTTCSILSVDPAFSQPSSRAPVSCMAHEVTASEIEQLLRDIISTVHSHSATCLTVDWGKFHC